MKKIIGYKAPTSLFNGNILKGQQYRPLSSIRNTTYCATTDSGSTIDSGKYNLPKEIVETWEPVYEEDKFKVGDWVYVIEAQDGAKGSETRIGVVTNETVQSGTDDTDVRVKLEERVWGVGRLSRISLRLATEKEILNHLQKEFTEKTGIDIGSSVCSCSDYEYIVTGFNLFIRNIYDGKQSSVTADWFDANPKEKYQLGVICGGSTLNVSCTLVNKLTFGGYDVKLQKVQSGVRVHCNNEIGTLTQAEEIYDFLIDKFKILRFGAVELKSCTYDDESIWENTQSNTPKTVTLGCTTGTWIEFVAILEEARKLNK